MMDRDIASQRLLNQRIASAQLKEPEEVVRWMGALQAQDYQQSLWAIGLRMQSGTMTAVEQAIADRKILRTWPMRGTLHFVPPEDAKWMLQLSAARMIAKDRRRLEQLELDQAIIERAKILCYDALSGGKQLSRSALMQILEDAGIRTTGQRGYHILWHLAQTCLICLGPMQEKQQTFVLLDEWVPFSRKFSREEALAQLAGRYVASHGPATIQDFAFWAGLPMSDAKTGVLAARAGLLSEKRNDQEYWRASDVIGEAEHTPSGVFLLPGFDEYLLGYKDRTAVLAAEHSQKIVPGGNGVFKPMVVVEGQVVGTWKRQIRKNALDLIVIPFTPLDDVEQEASSVVKRYSHFLGLSSATLAIQASDEALSPSS